MESLFGTVLFYTPTLKPTLNSSIIYNEETHLTYYSLEKLDQSNIEIPIYYNFPFVLNKDGSLWDDATHFLLWKIKDNPSLSEERLRQYADTLQSFKKFCEIIEDKEIDEPEYRKFNYLKAPIKSRRPNVMFGKFLYENKAKQWGEKMKKVSAFYKYLIDIRGIKFDVDMLETVTSQMIINTSSGNSFIKKISYNKVDSTFKNSNDNDDYIRDGEKMRPMSMDEQKIFEAAIFESKNEELVLGVMIAITSMIRKQTVYTLRLKNFIKSLPINYNKYTIEHWKKENLYPITNNSLLEINVGNGTGVDTKMGKRYKIKIEGWLHKAIVEYIISERAVSRRLIALSQKNELEQYVFLSRDGNPYYHATDDINLKEWKILGNKEKKGNSIDQAMKRFRDEELTSQCKKTKSDIFPVRFHDLRATAGMRYLDRNESRVDGKRIKWGTILRELGKLMAHDNISTTQRYLDFKQLIEETLPQLQFDFEKDRMEKIIERTNY